LYAAGLHPMHGREGMGCDAMRWDATGCVSWRERAVLDVATIGRARWNAVPAIIARGDAPSVAMNTIALFRFVGGCIAGGR